MPRCWHCKTETSAAHYDRIVHNKLALYADWDGWRMAGRFLIAPGKAGKITPQRLLGMMWQESHARRVSGTRPDTKKAAHEATIFLLPALERFDGQA